MSRLMKTMSSPRVSRLDDDDAFAAFTFVAIPFVAAQPSHHLPPAVFFTSAVAA
jgi:hypothetical protein